MVLVFTLGGVCFAQSDPGINSSGWRSLERLEHLFHHLQAGGEDQDLQTGAVRRGETLSRQGVLQLWAETMLNSVKK